MISTKMLLTCNQLTTMSTHSSSAKTKSVQSILCGDDGTSKPEFGLLAFVEFATSNESVMVAVVAEFADFSEKLATRKSARSILNASILQSAPVLAANNRNH